MRSIPCAVLAVVALTGAPALYAQEQPAPQGASGGIAEYTALLTEIAGLDVYNQMVEQHLEAQQRVVEELQIAMEGVPPLEEQLPPLLTRMFDSLVSFIQADVPFEPEERQRSLATLQEVVARPDVDNVEKFRRVLEAWEIENEYGNTFSAYVGELEIDGVPHDVEFLRIGRIALLYQTPDLQYTGAWDHRTQEWALLSNTQRNSVREALRMARAQIAPAMVLLPVLPPEE